MANIYPACFVRSHLFVRHKHLQIDTDFEFLPSDTSDPNVETLCHSAKEGTHGWTHSTSDTGFGTPHRPSRRPRNQFISPGRIFYPSPRDARNISDASAATPRGPVGSVDYATAATGIPPPVPQLPRKYMTETPCQQTSFTEEKDDISVDGSSSAMHNMMEILRTESLLANANVRGVIATYALYLVR